MEAVIFGYAPVGMVGELVTVEVDLRRGIPGVDIVGLPDDAVRESRERVRPFATAASSSPATGC